MKQNREKKNGTLLKRIMKKMSYGITLNLGRSTYGNITVYHKMNSLFKKYRIIDYKRIIYSEGSLIFKEKRQTHTAFIGLVYYFIGIFSFIILPENLKMNEMYKGFSYNFIKKSNYSIFLKKVPTGIWIHHLEIRSGLGAKIARSAGSKCYIYSKEKNEIYVKLSSGRLLKLTPYCVCVFGIGSNKEYHIQNKGKAGYNFKYGRRPKVRGVAMNPVDHPHGGGEGKKSKPAIQKTPWGKQAKNKKTKKIKK